MKKIILSLLCTIFVGSIQAQVANQADDLLECDTNNDGFAIFDLTFNDATIFGSQDPTDFILTYHISLVDAQAGVNAIGPANSYQNVTNPQEIYARLEAIATGDFDTTSFSLVVLANPEANPPFQLEVCDSDGDGFAEFSLTDKDEEITFGDPLWTVSYHETLSDAELGILPLASPYTNTIPFNDMVYARVEDITNGCHDTVSLALVVYIDCPVIEDSPDNVFINEGDGDGLAIFDLTINEDQMLGGQDPVVYLFSYHLSLQDCIRDENELPTPEAYQNTTNPQTIFVRFFNDNTGGYVVASFDIETDGVLGQSDEFDTNFTIYPNPFSDGLSITFFEEASDISIRLFDMNGRQLFTYHEAMSTERIELTMPELAQGIYWLEITSEEKIAVKQLLRR
ncbi:MAG: T9SS type A sorting domain-containing protein [Bacteroidota bacterium]